MIAEIIAVGTELLMGQINNTNARYISEKFPDADVYVYYHTVVGDNSGRLSECIENAMNRTDVVLLTGGLGPTQDDITKETVAKVLGLELIPDKMTLKGIDAFFKKRGRKACANNEKQAYFPKGSIIVRNENGTAPGCIIEHNGKIVILLPGPPYEMEPMFENAILPYFMKNAKYKLYSVYIKMFGIGESSMEDKISDLVVQQSNPTIAPYAKRGELTLRITLKYIPDEENPGELIKPIIDKIKKRLGKYIYSYENEELMETTAKLLIENSMKIAIAESCTGGMLSSMLTGVPGISAVLDRSVVAYSYKSKIEELDVRKTTLDKFGAVSPETAKEMAEGIMKKAKTDIGVAITGIAGPGGGNDKKPPGLVYASLASKNGTIVKKLDLWGGRERIRYIACLNALDMIRRHILKPEDL